MRDGCRSVGSEGRPRVAAAVFDLQLQLSDADLHNTSSRGRSECREQKRRNCFIPSRRVRILTSLWFSSSLRPRISSCCLYTACSSWKENGRRGGSVPGGCSGFSPEPSRLTSLSAGRGLSAGSQQIRSGIWVPSGCQPVRSLGSRGYLASW